MNLERTMATRQGEGMVWRVQKVVEWEIGAEGYKEKEQKRARSRHLRTKDPEGSYSTGPG